MYCQQPRHSKKIINNCTICVLQSYSGPSDPFFSMAIVLVLVLVFLVLSPIFPLLILSISCSESSRTSWRWQKKRRPGRIGSPECFKWLTCKNKIREKWMFHGAQLDYLSAFYSIRKGSVFENVFENYEKFPCWKSIWTMSYFISPPVEHSYDFSSWSNRECPCSGRP